jgi:anthranilate phosphoribosyltransferase
VGPVRDIVLLNAAAGIVSYRLAEDPSRVQESIVDRFAAAMAIAVETIDSGAATRTLDAWVHATSASTA